MVKCSQHGRVAVPNPPRQDCSECWAAFGRWCWARVSASRTVSKGRAKGGGQSSKAKGRSGVQAVAQLLCEELGLSPQDVFVKATSQVGVDLHLAEFALGVFPYSVEVKNQETLNIWAALRQAAENSSEACPPVLFFKRAHTEMFVAIGARAFLRLVKRAH